ncbi:hypothetical protein OH77DRAFT_1521979 [Trametes cingulata]|nr:hypothetical protein OH77DRAFT_1521979 [Trametes cingulata]
MYMRNLLSLTGARSDAAFSSAVIGDVARQTAFNAYDAGLFTPLGDLSALSPTQFTRLAHPAFPHHSVRVKESRFCDEEVRAYTGYIDVEARHLFFYFFESRRDTDTDDVI